MKELVIVLSQADKAALGSVRCCRAWRRRRRKGFIWVRGIEANEKIDLRIKQLPGLHTYTLDADTNLFPPNALTPVGKLKQLNWIPIAEYITVKLPVSALPGKINLAAYDQAGAFWAAHKQVTPCLPIWLPGKHMRNTAPLIRLQQTRFAVSEKNKVLIIELPAGTAGKGIRVTGYHYCCHAVLNLTRRPSVSWLLPASIR